MLNYEQIKKALKYNGFNYVKLEFEAGIKKTGESCEICGGAGTIECPECEGAGRVMVEAICDGREYEESCYECDGEGHIDCECQDEECGFEEDHNKVGAMFYALLPKGFKPIFFKPYHDGSVGTEVTMTFNVSMLDKAEKVIEAFRMACEEFGTIDVSNAGFHISLLRTSMYPGLPLPPKKLRNFINAMDKIVNAMFLLASKDGKTTRGTYFRYPQVKDGTKYSAIYTHRGSCIEYRIFDTCYDNPERFLLFMNTIVRTLKFYSDKVRLIEKWNNKDFDVRDGGDRNMKVEEMFSGRDWEKLLFSKLGYLYHDKKKLDMVKKAYERGICDKKKLLLSLSN